MKEERNKPSISLDMAELRLACLMVDYRDEPEICKVLNKKRLWLAGVRRKRAAAEVETPPVRGPARPRRLFGQPIAA